MKLLALDFDGVIADSAPEAFAVATRTFCELRPDTALRHADERGLYRDFLALMPLGNRAEDYGAALAAIEVGAAVPDQAAYDAFRASLDPRWLRQYHQRFYRVRDALSEADRAAWLALLRPYPDLVSLLRRRAGSARYAIATAKDRRSVAILLAEWGIADLFASDAILDKETGVAKTAHLEHLSRAFGVDPPEITFVDDKVNHLEAAAPLGVRCALAAWGYNGPREHALARARGYLVCTLANLESQLFDRGVGGGAASGWGDRGLT
ncbi:MAG TPA: HAD family hydrolase [Myxococcota bacterium]|nr:HAD family hydrolase [Myxococcota bacterium]